MQKGRCPKKRLSLQAGIRILVQPGNHAGTVKSVEMNGTAVSLAMAGDTVDVALNGIDTAAVSVGSMLCLPQWPVPLVTRFEARVVVLDIAMPILKGRQVSLTAFMSSNTALYHCVFLPKQKPSSWTLLCVTSCVFDHLRHLNELTVIYEAMHHECPSITLSLGL